MHSHNVTICAGCMLTDLRLVVARLSEHNDTMEFTDQTLFAERTLQEILEMIENAQALLEAGSHFAEA